MPRVVSWSLVRNAGCWGSSFYGAVDNSDQGIGAVGLALCPRATVLRRNGSGVRPIEMP